MRRITSVLMSIIMILLVVLPSFTAYAESDISFYNDGMPSGTYILGEKDYFNVVGWAFSKSGLQTDCYYKLDGNELVKLNPVKRTDVMKEKPDCQQESCGYNTQFLIKDIQSGDHTLTVFAKNDNEQVIIASSVFTIKGIKSDVNAIPSGTYEAESTESLLIGGWAFNANGAETVCYYSINNGGKTAIPRIVRNDVVSAYSDCLQPDCGFHYQIPVMNFSAGENTISLYAVSDGYTQKMGESTFTVTSSYKGVMKQSADKYPSGEMLKSENLNYLVSGWCFDANGGNVKLFYQFDDGELNAFTPVERTDVKKAFDECKQLDVGYHQTISFENLSIGSHTYKVVAKSGFYTEVVAEKEFTLIGDEAKLKYNSDFILNGVYDLSKTTRGKVQGWAYNINGSHIKCYAQIDGGKSFYIPLENRTDVMNALDDCYQIECGYKHEINLANLSAGSHTIDITVKSGELSDKIASGTFSIIKPDFTVGFNLNGGTGVVNSLTKRYGVNLKLGTAIPQKDMFTFKEWNTNPDGSGESYRSGDYYKSNSNATLYAIWQRDSFVPKDSDSVKINYKQNAIYADFSCMTASEVKSEFKNSNINLTTEFAVTGAEINLTDSGVVYEKATLIIPGDINCDGAYDGEDAVLAACIEQNILNENNLQYAVHAGDFNFDGKVDEEDYELLNQAGIGLSKPDMTMAKNEGKYDTEFEIKTGAMTENSVVMNGQEMSAEISNSTKALNVELNCSTDEFNYFGLAYTSADYAQGTIQYIRNGQVYSEKFFLEPSEKTNCFYSYTDDILEDVRVKDIVSIKFVPLNNSELNLSINGIATFNRETPETITYVSNSQVKIGVNLEWGGSLSYYEDLDSDVQAVSSGGLIHIDSNASERYNAEICNDSVNLINCHDAGRLVQQSYYGTRNYDMGFYNGHYCAYNPVQGGNMYNDASKIVDVRAEGNVLYVKCRPLDWAKAKEFITDSYMEATYTLIGDTVKTQCRFVDYSGYDPAEAGQELPAFYGAATMDRFVYYGGNNPWTDDKLSEASGLDEYEYARYPSFSTTECWGALTGEFEDSFSIGLYIPDVTTMLAGVYSFVASQDENPDTSNPTSYLAGMRKILFKSYETINYDFYITTGTVDEIRNTFKSIAVK